MSLPEDPEGIQPESVVSHRAAANPSLSFAVLTVSDTRTESSDSGGGLIREKLAGAGHRIEAAAIVRDEVDDIARTVRSWTGNGAVDVVIVTGGTGLAHRDRTVEAVQPLLDRTIDGFGELFRMLSYGDVGSAAMLSRAFAGVIGQVPLFALPGSRNAIALAMDRLILPEIAHVVFECRK